MTLNLNAGRPRFVTCKNCGMSNEDEAVETIEAGFTKCRYCDAWHYMDWGNKIELMGFMCPDCWGEGTIDGEAGREYCVLCEGTGFVGVRGGAYA